MAGPAIVVCTQDTWVKVATGVTAARLDIKDLTPSKYVVTYVDTTGAAPTTLEKALSFKGRTFFFASSTSSDIYVRAIGAAGSVQVGAGLTA